MSGPGNHAPSVTKARRDHLWVLFVVAASVLAEVWASWVGIGSISGFPRIGPIPTDWVLAVAMEAYWGYALYAWLVASPGPRSRAMAMWSCAAVFVLSLIGQVLYHEITAPAATPLGKRFVIGFVTSLPVIVLALIAVLIHLRHADRAEVAETERGVVEQTELVAVRAELSEALKAAQAMRTSVEAARAETAEAVAKAEVLAQKPASTAKPKTPRRSTRKQDQGSGTAAASTASTAASAERTFDELLADARAYRAELAAAGKGERPTKERLRLRFGVSSGTALALCRALKDDEPAEAPEAPGAVG